jgi:putative tryptophan/tyrosine transport system substrate-binding protein
MLAILLMVTGVLFAPLAAEGQPRTYRIGILVPEMGRAQSQATKGLKDEFRQLGYQEGKQIVFDTQDAKGDRGALQPAAARLVGQKSDVILTTGTRATQVAKATTGEIPIVFIHPSDPISLGLIKSMEDSGANLTGVAAFASQATDKRLAILKEIMPKLQRVHLIYDSNDKFARQNFELAKTAAGKLSLQTLEYGVKSAEELKATVGRLENREGDALFQMPDDLVESEADFIFDAARKKKLPTMFNEEMWAIRGAMASYGPSYYAMGGQAARIVARIIKGQKPQTVPTQRADKFELILNYRTANFIGVNFPQELLKKADKVIR